MRLLMCVMVAWGLLVQPMLAGAIGVCGCCQGGQPAVERSGSGASDAGSRSCCSMEESATANDAGPVAPSDHGIPGRGCDCPRPCCASAAPMALSLSAGGGWLDEGLARNVQLDEAPASRPSPHLDRLLRPPRAGAFVL